MIRAFYAMGLDSFREAKDRKISRILMYLSVFVAIGVGLLGYKEIEPREFLEKAVRSGRAPFGARFEVVKVEPGGTSGRAKSFVAQVALDERSIPTSSMSDDARDEAVSQAMRKGLEGRNVRLDAIGRVAGARQAVYSVSYTYPDPLDVAGLMKLSFAGLKDFGLDFGEGIGEPGLAFSGRYFISIIEGIIANAIAGWIGIIIAVIATAGFVPSMLQGGTAHLLLAKPNPRWVLLAGKYVGGVAFVLYHALVLCALVALAIFVRTGWFDARFLLIALMLAALFAMIYAISCLVAVLFESPIVSILLAIGYWVFCAFLAIAKHDLPIMLEQMGQQTGDRIEVPLVITRSVDGVYWALPKTRDVSYLVAETVSEGREPPELAAMTRKNKPKVDYVWSGISSGVATLVLLGLACVVFARRDY